jgi:hypothetical protein
MALSSMDDLTPEVTDGAVDSTTGLERSTTRRGNVKRRSGEQFEVEVGLQNVNAYSPQ